MRNDIGNVFAARLQVLKQLPAKEEEVEFCSMSEKQLVLYQNLFKKLKSSVNGESESLSARRELPVSNTAALIPRVASVRRARAVQRHDAAEEDGQSPSSSPTVLHQGEAQSHEQTHAQGPLFFSCPCFSLSSLHPLGFFIIQLVPPTGANSL